MTQIKRKLPALMLVLAMIITLMPLLNVSAGAVAFSWMNGAKSVKSGSTYSTTMSQKGNWSVYKISVKRDGILKIDLTAKADYTAVEVVENYGDKVALTWKDIKTGNFSIYNESGKNSIAIWDKNAGKSVTRAVCSVSKGTYYVRFAHRDSADSVCTEGTGKISFKLTFPATASEKDDAKQLFSGKEITVKNAHYKGDKKVYVLNVRKSGELQLNFSTEMYEANVKLFKSNLEDQVEITNVSTARGEIKSGGKGCEYVFVKPYTAQTCSSNSFNKYNNVTIACRDFYKAESHSHYSGTFTYNVKKGVYYLVIENTGNLCQGEVKQSLYGRYDTYYSFANCPNNPIIYEDKWLTYSYPNIYDTETMKIKAVFPDAGELAPAEPEVDPDITMSIKKGKTLNAAALCDLTGTIKWTTSNKSVATVSSTGKVTAKKAGKVYITGTSGKKTFVLLLTVK